MMTALSKRLGRKNRPAAAFVAFAVACTLGGDAFAQATSQSLDHVPPPEGLVKIASTWTDRAPIESITVIGETQNDITEFYVYVPRDGQRLTLQMQSACDFGTVYRAVNGDVLFDRRGDVSSGDELCDEFWPLQAGDEFETIEGLQVRIDSIDTFEFNVDGEVETAIGYDARSQGSRGGPEVQRVSVQGYGSVLQIIPDLSLSLPSIMQRFDEPGLSHVFARCHIEGDLVTCFCVVEQAEQHLELETLRQVADNVRVATTSVVPITSDQENTDVIAFVEASDQSCSFDAFPLLN
ncbi:MAG: hypothetical protein AAGH60_10700 [Pseudomonadota bacterium]